MTPIEFAAAVQAVAAVVIAGLTALLALSAFWSNREAARQRALAAIPVVEVRQPNVEVSLADLDQRVVTSVAAVATLANGNAVALNMRISVRGDAVRGRRPESGGTVKHVAALAPGQQISVPLDIGNLLDPAFFDVGASPQTRAFRYDAVSVEVSYEGLLGAHVEQAFEWAPNAGTDPYIQPWRIRRISVTAPGIEAIDITYPDEDERSAAELNKAIADAVRK